MPSRRRKNRQFGRKWFLLGGASLFLVGSLLCGTSHTMDEASLGLFKETALDHTRVVPIPCLLVGFLLYLPLLGRTQAPLGTTGRFRKIPCPERLFRHSSGPGSSSAMNCTHSTSSSSVFAWQMKPPGCPGSARQLLLPSGARRAVSWSTRRPGGVAGPIGMPIAQPVGAPASAILERPCGCRSRGWKRPPGLLPVRHCLPRHPLRLHRFRLNIRSSFLRG